MKPLFAVLIVFLSAVDTIAAPATMRVDYYHTGNEKEERFSLDRVLIEPLPWPGHPAKSIDTTSNPRTRPSVNTGRAAIRGKKAANSWNCCRFQRSVGWSWHWAH